MYWRLGKGYAHGNLYVYASFNGIIIVQMLYPMVL
jgi:hypothetical protein